MLLRSITAALLTSLAAAQSPLTQPRTVDDLLPASTYASVRFGGLDACRQATGQQPLAAVVHTFLSQLPEEMRAEILDEKIDEAVHHIRQTLKREGLDPADIRAFVSQPMTMAIGRLSIEGMGPSVCLVIEEGNQRKAINRCVRAFLNIIQRMGADVKVNRIELAGKPFYHAAIDGVPVFAGSIDGNYCISNSRGYLKEVVSVAAGKKQGLTAATRIAGLRQQLPAPPLAAWTVNPSTVMDAVAPLLPYEAADMADALGVGRLDLLYGAMTATQDGGTDLMHIGLAGRENGLMKSLVSAPADLSFASKCSQNTVLFGAGSFDVPAVIDAFQRFIKLLPEEAQREMRREMGGEMMREFRQMGTSPAEVHRLLKALGNQVGFAIALKKGPIPMPELLMHMSVRELEPVQGMLMRLEGMMAQEAGVEWRSRKAGDHQIRFCNVDVEGKIKLSPCYVLTQNGLWIGSDVGGMVRALRRDADDSLAVTEDFVHLAKESAGASGVVHMRTFRGVEIAWRSVETMVFPMIDSNSDELGFDSDALPDSEELAEALGTTTMIYRVDDHGVTVKSKGPMVMGAWIAALGSIADEMLSRATGKVF